MGGSKILIIFFSLLALTFFISPKKNFHAFLVCSAPEQISTHLLTPNCPFFVCWRGGGRKTSRLLSPFCSGTPPASAIYLPFFLLPHQDTHTGPWAMAEIVEHASSERPLELQLRKRSSGDLVVENVATVLTHSKGSNTARDHGHLGGLLAGKLGSNKFVVRTLYSLSAALHDHAQVDYAVDARSKCRLAGCKQQICQCSLRLGKIPPALK